MRLKTQPFVSNFTEGSHYAYNICPVDCQTSQASQTNSVFKIHVIERNSPVHFLESCFYLGNSFLKNSYERTIEYTK